MGLLDRMFTGGMLAGTPAPDDDFWYRGVGDMTQAGIRVDAEGAKKISAWYRGRDILATSLAMLPLKMYRRLPDNKGRDEASSYPLHEVIHRKPNALMDSFRWRRQKMYHLIDHGNGYDRIIGGDRAFAEQLIPIHPTRVKPEQVSDTQVVYHVKQANGTTRTYRSDDIFHLCGACDDGVEGKGILQYARETIGQGIALDSYAQRLFTQGTLHSGFIKLPAGVSMDKDAKERTKQQFATGPMSWHTPRILELGAEFQESTLTPEDSQFILSRKFTVTDIARWLGLPPHMLADLERSTNNNIEHQGQEFVTYNLGPWLSLWEAAINDQLVVANKTYFAEFVRDALVQGDIATRWEAYVKSTNAGIVTRNEVRRKENLPALDGLDEPLSPANITGNGGSQNTPRDRKPAAEPSRAEAVVVAQAERLLRTEVAFVQKTAVACADDRDAFVARVTEFYATHAGFVERTLLLPLAEAKGYCAGQASQIVNGDWVSAVESWQTLDYAKGLAWLAIGEPASEVA